MHNVFFVQVGQTLCYLVELCDMFRQNHLPSSTRIDIPKHTGQSLLRTYQTS
jgi:hypothetical protein